MRLPPIPVPRIGRQRVRVLPVFCGLAGLALALKLGSLFMAAGQLVLAEAHAAPPEAPSARPAPPPPPVDPDTLQALAQRRAEIDKRTEEMREREAVLAATEKRVEEKIARLHEIEKSIDNAAKQRDGEEEARIKSLVRIYETMKPKEAARVFEQLEMPVLLSVLQRMKEIKSAPILASMEPAKAKAVTVAIALKNDAKPAKK
jgi:flagellar motility protein MotE (MotC chaperone)